MRLSISNQFILYGILIVCVPFMVITLLGLVSYKEKNDDHVKSLIEFGIELTQFNIDKNAKMLDIVVHLIETSLQNTHSLTLNPALTDYFKQLDTHLVWSTGHPESSTVLGIKPINHCLNDYTGVVSSKAEGYPRLYYYAQTRVNHPTRPVCIQASLPLDKKLKLQSILKRFSGFNLRVVVFDHHQATAVSASNNRLKSMANNWVFQENNPHHYHIETMDNWRYISSWRPLNDPQGKPIGGIIVSAPQTDLADYFSDKLLFFWMTALGCFAVIILMGKRFHSDWLLPIDQIISALEGVSLGNYQIRLGFKPRPQPLKNLQANFNRILTVFEEEKKMRETFISCLAHDLKTPLYSQKRIISVLQSDRDTFDPDTQAILTNLMQTNNELYDLVHLLLESYRNDDVTIELLKSPCDVKALIEECAEGVQESTTKKALTVTISTLHELQPVMLDKRQMKRVLTNLLQNALENSHQGGTIAFELSQNPTGVIITIQDDGPGIAPDNLPYIFQRYWSTKNRQQTLSSGLGLYIVRMIIEAHGGTITVDSVLDQGTTFTFYLPKEDTP